MHGPELEKQNCISSQTSQHQTRAEKNPLACVTEEPRPREQVGQRPVSPRMGARSGGTYLGYCPRVLAGCFPRCSLWINSFPPLLLLPSSFGVYFHPPSFGLPFLLFPPSSPFSLPKAWLGRACMEENPASSQLPALPLACCSGFMFDSNSTIYTAETSGPNRTSQEPARNLSFS